MSEIMMERYWINQPSSLQPDHGYHGLCVIAPRNLGKEKVVTVYFATGTSTSARMFTASLSPGWPSTLAPIKP